MLTVFDYGLQLSVRKLSYLRDLNGQLLAVLEESFFLHVIGCENILLDTFLVLIWTVLVEALGLLQVELAVLGSPVRCSDQSAIIRELVEGQDGETRFLWG